MATDISGKPMNTSEGWNSSGLSILGAGISFAGTTLSTMGNYMSAQSTQRQLEWQADQYRIQARLIEVRGEVKRRQHKKQHERDMGRVVRDVGRSGVMGSSRSTLKLQQLMVKESAIERYWIKEETSIMAQQARAAAKQSDARARDIGAAARISAVGSMLGGAAKAFSMLGGALGGTTQPKGQRAAVRVPWSRDVNSPMYDPTSIAPTLKVRVPWARDVNSPMYDPTSIAPTLNKRP